jgi:hypothetical protein
MTTAMFRGSRGLAAAATVAACAASSRPAGAQAATRVDYSASAGCPDEGAFVARVRARTSRLHPPSSGEAASEYRVQVTAREAGARGTLTVIEPSGATSSREVEGDTCESVVEALALIAALALDPDASTAALPPMPAPAPSTPKASSAPAQGAAGGDTPSVISRDTAAGARSEPPALAPWAGHLAAIAGAELTSGLTPGALVGPALSVEAVWRRRDRPRAVEPVLDVRLGVSRLAASVPAQVGSARFTWTLGRLEGCPVRVVVGSFEALPCVRFDGGDLQAVGLGVDLPRPAASRLWLSLGALGRLRWTPLAPIFLEVDAGVSAPLVRDRFYFDTPPTTIYDVPALAAIAGAAAGGRFW